MLCCVCVFLKFWNFTKILSVLRVSFNSPLHDPDVGSLVETKKGSVRSSFSITVKQDTIFYAPMGVLLKCS